MPLSNDHLVDVQARLIAAATAAESHVFRSRVSNLPESFMPAIVAYAPRFGLAPLGAGHPRYLITHTIAVECRVMMLDDFDTAALSLAQEVMVALFGDPDWTARWKATPAVECEIVLSGEGEKGFAAALLTLTCADAASTDFIPSPTIPVGPEITGFDIHVDSVDNGAPLDPYEAEITIDNPAI